MKKYLKKELALTINELDNIKENNQYTQIQEMITEILCILNDYQSNKSYKFQNNQLIQLGKKDINQYDLKFISELVKIYADMPLLDTEYPFDYPTLATIKDDNLDNVVTFWNKLFNQELQKREYSIIDNNQIKVYKGLNILRNGKYILYNNPVIGHIQFLFKREQTIRDYIVPCGILIKKLEPFSNTNYNNAIGIIQHYMEIKAMYKYYDINPKEADKYQLIFNDLLILQARKIKNNIESKWNNLSYLDKGIIYNFVNSIMGVELAKHSKMNLKQLVDYYSKNIESIPLIISKDEVINHSKELSKKFKFHQI